MAMTRSKTGTRARVAWGVATGSAILVVLFVVYDLTLGNGWSDAILAMTLVLAVGAFGVVGATIASRTGNAVGWALLAFIGIFAVAGSAESYATYSLLNAAQPLPLTSFFAWVGTMMFYVTLASIVSIPLLYPTGTPQWRWVWRLYLAIRRRIDRRVRDPPARAQPDWRTTCRGLPTPMRSRHGARRSG